MAESVHLAVRFLHVLAMALVLGGAVVLWGLFHRLDQTTDGSAELATASRYEWLFWTAVGALVATGVGNLGALSPGVPGPTTGWGRTLAVKLLAVVAFLLLSAVRTALVDRLEHRPIAPSASECRLLARSYAATAIYLGAVVALAEVLAHG